MALILSSTGSSTDPNNLSVTPTDLTKTVRRKAEKYEMPSSQIYLPLGRIWYYEISFTIEGQTEYDKLTTILDTVVNGFNKIYISTDSSNIFEFETYPTFGEYYVDQCVIRAVAGAPTIRDVKLTIYE